MWDWKKFFKSIGTENWIVVDRGGGRGNRDRLIKGTDWGTQRWGRGGGEGKRLTGEHICIYT